MQYARLLVEYKRVKMLKPYTCITDLLKYNTAVHCAMWEDDDDSL